MSERLFLRLHDDPLHGPEADVPAGTLRAFEVPPPLARHVSHILLYRESLPAGHEVAERVLPDGSLRLVFNLGDPPSVDGVPGRAAEAVGAIAAPAVVLLRGRVEGLSVTLRPGAAAALLGVPAGELNHGTAALEDLWRGSGALLQQIAELRGDDQRATLLVGALLHRQRQHEGRSPTAEQAAWHAAGLIAASGGQRPLREVAAAAGVGERRLQQLFHAHVGLPPRTWSRLARLHACLRALRHETRPAWADLAAERGFYDQAHLVKEFRALSGFTPVEFFGRVSASSKTAA